MKSILNNLTKKERHLLLRIIIALIIYIIVICIHAASKGPWGIPLSLALFAIPYLIAGYDVIRGAFLNIKNARFLDENFLMTIATFGAFAVGELMEAAAVMLFYQIGELFQSYAVNKSRRSIKDLMDICPEFANLEKDGEIEVVDPDDVEIGDIIVIKPGEKVPLDGTVISGESYLDTSPLTGESVPRIIREGDEIYSGCINKEGVLRVRADKEFDDSTVARILELVEEASNRKAHTENFITRFAKYYTPVVVICAVILAVFPPLILHQHWSIWLERACIFLVISCPCALVISVPLGFFGGIGAASKKGILIKGGNYIEGLAHLDTVIFDKTGTLTKGDFAVSGIYPASGSDITETELLKTAADIEKYSTHPVGRSVCTAWQELNGLPSPEHAPGLSELELELGPDVGDAFGKRLEKQLLEEQLSDEKSKVLTVSPAGISGQNVIEEETEIEEVSGQGIVASYGSSLTLIGNRKLMDAYGIEVENVEDPGTVLYIARSARPCNDNGTDTGYAGSDDDRNRHRYLGCIVISDTVKDDAADAVRKLKSSGISKTVMLTGDREESAAYIAELTGVDEHYSQLLPSDKVRILEEIISARSNKKRTVAFAGDGINDAPVLTRADVGIAMGSMGSDAAIEAADVVLMDDMPSRIPQAIQISKKTMRIVWQNIIFAIGIKVIFLILGALGLANMWEAVFADVGVCVIAILNSMRALRG